MSDRGGAAPTGIGSGHQISNEQVNSTGLRVPLKWQRVLRALVEGPKTTRELERPPVFDHVGHSTAAELRKMGIRLETEIVRIDGYAGEPARVARYTIAPESRDFAVRLLGGQP